MLMLENKIRTVETSLLGSRSSVISEAMNFRGSGVSSPQDTSRLLCILLAANVYGTRILGASA